jgi:hypothetical protein
VSALAPVERPSVCAVVDPELKQGLVALARENDRTEAAELRVALRRHVDRELATSRATTTAA